MPKSAPKPDPLPSTQIAMIRRFWRIFRLLSLFAIAVAVIAVVLVARGDKAIHVHMIVATALGTGLTVLVGAALMTLAFLSSSSGHDEAAAKKQEEEEID